MKHCNKAYIVFGFLSLSCVTKDRPVSEANNTETIAIQSWDNQGYAICSDGTIQIVGTQDIVYKRLCQSNQDGAIKVANVKAISLDEDQWFQVSCQTPPGKMEKVKLKSIIEGAVCQ